MYSKLAHNIVESSVWYRSDAVLRVWLLVLVKTDFKTGVFEMPIPAIAGLARLTVEQVEEALEELESPDPYSRSQEEGGRRLVRLGERPAWRVVNWHEYQRMRNLEERRAYQRQWIAEKRKSAVDSGLQMSTMSTNEDEDEDEDEEKPPPSSYSEPQADSELEQLMKFPVKGGEEWGLTQKLVDVLTEAFPGIDILAEARKAKAWLIANPVKQKTPRGMSRFLHGWVEKANNRGTAAGQGSGQTSDFNATFARIVGGVDGN